MKLFKSQQEIANEMHEEVLKTHSISDLRIPINVIWWNKAILYPFIGIISICIFLIGHRVVLASKVRCSDYPTQAMAQIAFDSDPHYYYMLDRDHDGRACEHLPKFIRVK